MFRSFPLLFALFFCFLTSCEAPDPPPPEPEGPPPNPQAAAAELFQQAMAAQDSSDFEAARDHLEAALRLRPHHPTLTYRMAQAYARAGAPEEARGALRRLAEMGVAVDPSADSTFDALTGTPAFSGILALFEQNQQPVGAGEAAFTWPEPDFVPEGVAFDPVDQAFYVSSVHKRKVVRVRDGRAEDFATQDDGLWSAFGMKVDAERRLLWVCTGAIPNAAEVDSLALGRTGVFKYDLTTGRLAERYLLPDDGGEHWFGDLALADDGTVYATDSQGGGIHTIEADGDSLALFLASDAFASLQGLALSADQEHLYVADYARGIFKVDLATKELVLLPYPQNATLLGIDGLYADGNTLLAIQNGIRPHRVVRAYLDGDATAITRVEVVEANHASYDEPTLGTVVGDTLFYVANSLWGHFDAGGQLQREQLSDPVVLRLVLR